MLSYVLKRLLQSIFVMLFVAFACFVLSNYVGDPVNNMVGQEATIADRAALRQGDWKIVRPLTRGRPGRWQLFDLAGDVGETSDLAEREPERLATLVKSGARLNDIAVDEDDGLILVIGASGGQTLYLAVGAWLLAEWDELPE